MTTSTRRRTRPTIETFYSPRFLRLLDSRTCTHDEPRGPRYCYPCRVELRRMSAGLPITNQDDDR